MPAKSQYWKYFEKIDGYMARCRSCSKILKTSGNTTNLRLHIQKMHSILLSREQSQQSVNIDTSQLSKRCRGNEFSSFDESQPSTSSAGILENQREVKMSDSETDTYSDCEKIDVQCTSIVKQYVQPTLKSSFRSISEFGETGAKGIRITNAILYMMCKDAQPFQIVENKGFLNLMKVAAPLYKVPSRFTFKRMLEDKFTVIQKYFLDKLKTVTNYTLTTDIWTDTLQTRSFLGVTVHFPDNDKLESATLGTYELSEHHTGEYISQILLKTCDEWKLDRSKVMAIVTDGGANMIKAIDLSFGRKCHIPCFAHMLNLVAQKSVENTATLPNLINSVKKIVTWFKQSVTASDELRKEADLKLIQEVSTRWNSTFYMLERFLKLRATVNKILICYPNAPPMIIAKDLLDLNEVCDVLRPIEVATREVSGQKYITSSKVIPLTRMIGNKIIALQPKTTIGIQLQKSLLSEMKKRLLPIESVNILAVSTILDPRFKQIHFQDPVACSKAIKTIKDLLSSIETDDNSQSNQEEEGSSATEFNLWSDHHKLVQEKNSMIPVQTETDMPSELGYYLKNPLSELNQEPLEIWNHIIGCTFPNLKPMAIKYLSCVASSTASERLFSKAGQVLTHQRNRLKGKLVSKILFLQSVDEKFWNL